LIRRLGKQAGRHQYEAESKHQGSAGEVLESAQENAKAEQYWTLADRSKPRKPPKHAGELARQRTGFHPIKAFLGAVLDDR
jgi:hypothetical protein